MRARYESFGGILSLDKPAATVYIDQAYMRGLGYAGSPLWSSGQTYLSAPVTAHFAVTYRCPLGCRTCYNGSGAARPDELSTDEAKAVLDTLAGMGVFTVAFGGGEPLARPDIFELAQHARARGLTPTMTTNGYYVDEETARRCRVFDHIHVSLDGVGETYRAVRGVDAFHHADRAIRLLRRQRIPVGVNCVVSRANFDHLEELARYLRRVGVRDVLLLRLKPAGRAAADYERARLTPEQVRAFFPRFAELTRRYRLRSHVDCAMVPFLYCHQPDEGIGGGDAAGAGVRVAVAEAGLASDAGGSGVGTRSILVASVVAWVAIPVAAEVSPSGVGPRATPIHSKMARTADKLTNLFI